MCAAPALAVNVSRFGVWRVGVTLLVMLSAGVGAAWFAMQVQDRVPIPIGAFVSAVAIFMAGVAVRCTRRPAVALRWDGQAWWIGPTTALFGREPQSCNLEVMIDLGAWLMVRLRPADTSAPIWLPLQQRGLEVQWHALRAALYSPQPAGGEGSPE